MRHEMRFLALAALLLATAPVGASQVYRMAGGICTDTYPHGEASVEDPVTGEIDVVDTGKLCADQVVAELRLADWYVPGTFFNTHDGSEPTHSGIVESFFFFDGYERIVLDSPFSPIRGQMPVHSGLGSILAQCSSSGGCGFWTTGSNWYFNVESDPDYRSEITYLKWVRAPEPGTLALLGLGLLSLVMTRRSAA